jgi:nitrite reductase/ring-hydroxylating ferredoxin subunit
MRIIQFWGKIFLFSVLILVVFTACDNKREEYIPYEYVSFTVDLNINNDLATPGFSQIYPMVGYGGVVIFCENFDYSAPDNSIFHAFDAACTYEVADTCRLTNEGNSFFGECPCCHSKYEFITGNPVEGVALYPLKYYQISIINNRLYIKN